MPLDNTPYIPQCLHRGVTITTQVHIQDPQPVGLRRRDAVSAVGPALHVGEHDVRAPLRDAVGAREALLLAGRASVADAVLDAGGEDVDGGEEESDEQRGFDMGHDGGVC